MPALGGSAEGGRFGACDESPWIEGAVDWAWPTAPAIGLVGTEGRAQ